MQESWQLWDPHAGHRHRNRWFVRIEPSGSLRKAGQCRESTPSPYELHPYVPARREAAAETILQQEPLQIIVMTPSSEDGATTQLQSSRRDDRGTETHQGESFDVFETGSRRGPQQGAASE